MTITAPEQQSNAATYALPFDCDNHYYEKIDAFTRHLDREYRHRGIEVIKRGTHTELLAGGRLFEFVPNPTFDPIIVPGCLDLLFRGQIPDGVDPRSLTKVQPLNPAFQDRDLRVEVLEAQGLSGALLLPTIGCGVEEALKDDIGALMASVQAFNRWLEDDWGYAYKGRIFATAMLSLADPDEAVKEVDRLIGQGVRIVSVRPAPVPAPYGRSSSLGNPMYDKVWAKLAEAGIPVAFHLSDSGYNRFAAAWGAPDRFVPFRNPNVLASLVVSDRAIHDTIASLIIDGVFTRHPALRVASIENGSDWVHLLIKRLRKQANQTPWAFTEDPADTIRRHVWVAPYYEEDVRKLADTIGADRVLFGSDWPHGEGLVNPIDFRDELDGFTESETDQVMRTNVLDLLGIDH
ncbi:amidohydrolase family protein [Acrocarpospora macrocephala]|uniref:Amidohydrolase n=1 Tax=Acrocarpospora macrocephala TaxID=150177 RepID=A0A5M3WRJ0_9ACTN|nr:amidohydrolase family protein [Acrocarpospora macrocephala]GES09363.1 amidohydrolase [Acrocarpospora macrocephala]